MTSHAAAQNFMNFSQKPLSNLVSGGSPCPRSPPHSLGGSGVPHSRKAWPGDSPLSHRAFFVPMPAQVITGPILLIALP